MKIIKNILILLVHIIYFTRVLRNKVIKLTIKIKSYVIKFKIRIFKTCLM